MRDIKFRGYSQRLKRWLHGNLVYANKKYYILPKSNEKSVIKVEKINKYLLIQAKEENRLVAPKSIGQYTRFVDKNKKEIYEGDIVKYRDNNLFIVEYITEKTMFRAVYIIKKDRDIFDDRLIGNRCEVIGNIFENPELLGGK